MNLRGTVSRFSLLRFALAAAVGALLVTCSQENKVVPGPSSGAVPSSSAKTPFVASAFDEGKQIGLAVVLYSAANHGRYPKAENSKDALQMLKPFLGDSKATVDLSKFEFNIAMADVTTASLSPSATATTVVCYERDLEADGSRCVVFADAHCRMVGAQEWSTLQSRLGP